MKKVIFTLSTLILLSCSGESIEVTNDQNLWVEDPITIIDDNHTRRIEPTTDVLPEPIPVVKELIAGQHYDIGSVTVDSDGITITVSYTIEDPNWTLVETHLFVGECGDQPMNGQGNPQVGRFPYKENHESGVSEFTYTIDMFTEGIDDSGCIAAHASVISADGTMSHTAWADGVYYSSGGGEEGNNWATIFGYQL